MAGTSASGYTLQIRLTNREFPYYPPTSLDYSGKDTDVLHMALGGISTEKDLSIKGMFDSVTTFAQNFSEDAVALKCGNCMCSPNDTGWTTAGNLLNHIKEEHNYPPPALGSSSNGR